MKVVFIGAHPDDIELGCAGTIYKHREDWNMTAHILVTQDAKQGRSPPQLQQSLSLLNSLGVSKVTSYDMTIRDLDRQLVWEILTAILQEKYDFVYVIAGQDHVDHTILSDQAIKVFQQNLIFYKVGEISPESNLFEVLTEEQLNTKLKGLKVFDLFQDRWYFDPDVLRARMVLMGAMIGEKYAEAFQIIRKVHAKC